MSTPTVQVPVPDPSLPRVFIPEFRVDPEAPVDGPTATAVVTQRVAQLGLFAVLSQEDVRAELDYSALKQALGVDDVDALASLGRAVAAHKLVYGSVGRVAGALVCTLTLIDVETGDIERRVGRTAKAEDEALVIQTLGAMADTLLAYLLTQYAPETVRPGRRWTTAAHPVAWATLAGGLGVAAATLILHGALGWQSEPVYWGLYGAGGALALTGGVLVALEVGGRRAPAETASSSSAPYLLRVGYRW